MSVSAERDLHARFEATYTLVAHRNRLPKPNFHRACDTADYVEPAIALAWTFYSIGYGKGVDA